jgi:hypothetical protein
MDYVITDSILKPNETGCISLLFNTEGKVGEQNLLATVEANTIDRFYLLRLNAVVKQRELFI